MSNENAAAPVQVQEPVPEAAQQNGGLVRAALIDLMALEREATSACDGFEAQRDCNLRFARARKALADSSDTAPVQPVAVLFNEERFAHMLNRLSVANRREGWTTNDPWKDREHLKRASDSVAYAEKEIRDYIVSLLAAPAAQGDANQAAIDVIAERKRQIESEGWKEARDDRYIDCELARAAATYALCLRPEELKICGVNAWPWPAHWWKPTSYRRNLVKSGALILAEIERIDRAAIAAKAAS